jgi:hypothetical protein
MARQSEINSAYIKIRDEAVRALRQTREEIRARESELDQLRRQEQQISGLLGPVPSAERPAAAGRRTNWTTVLEQLPKEFTASDVRKVQGLGEKASGEIFGAITRWINTKAVKRKDRGIYQRMG